MIQFNQDTEKTISELSSALVKLSFSLEEQSKLKKAATELLDSSTFLSASYQNSRLQNTPVNIIVKLDQALDYAGKCKFWLKFINDEGSLDHSRYEQLSRLLDKTFESLYLEKNRKENELPAYTGEWLLDF